MKPAVPCSGVNGNFVRISVIHAAGSEGPQSVELAHPMRFGEGFDWLKAACGSIW